MIPKSIKNNHLIPLLLIVLIGLCLRLVLAIFSDHIFYADELFQALEQGFRLHSGFGIISREFVTGVRSWMLPGSIGLILRLISLFGWNSPTVYIPVVKIVFSLISISLIVSIYYIFKSITKNQTQSLVAAGSIAIWYEFIYFSFRPFYVVIATYCYYISLAIVLNAKKPFSFLISGFFLSISIYLRPQIIPLIPITLFLWWVYHSKTMKRNFVYFVIGGVIAFIIAGFIDYHTWDSWFHSFYQYLFKNLRRGSELLSDPYKPQALPKSFYLSSILISSFFLSVFSLISTKKLRPLLLIPITIILTHSLIDHKEYRFIFAALPILISLAAVNIFTWLETKLSVKNALFLTCLIFSIVSLAGISNRLPNQSKIYFQQMTAKDPVLHIYQGIYSHPEICGLFDASRVYQLTGGYYYLGRNIPLYNLTYPPNESSPVNLIISRQPIKDVNFQLIDQQKNLFLYYSDMCSISKDTITPLLAN